MKNIFLKFGVVWVILVFVFTSLVITVHYIPRSKIIENVKSSVEVLEKEGVYKDLFNVWLFKLDNYTDALMLHIATVADDEHPISASMLNNRVDSPKNGPISSTSDFINNKYHYDYISPYGRYWHGNQALLRPLLTIFDYSGIRIINYFFIFILLVGCFILICKKISLQIAFLFLVSLILINFPMIPLSMQFSVCFHIAFISIILVLGIKKITETPVNLYLTFFVIGACTSFFDLLTTPQITLGLPLIFYCLKYKKNNLKTILLVCISWGLGYSLLWASKWLMVYILTEYNIFENAVNAAQIRSSNSLGNKDISILDFLLRNKPFLLVSIMYLLFLIGCIISLYLKRKRKLLLENSYLVLISLIVPVWYIFMLNHSVEHCWFTWRASIVTLLSILLFIYNVIKNKKLYGKENSSFNTLL